MNQLVDEFFSGNAILRNRLEELMQAPCLETRGIVYHVLTEFKFFRNVTPPIDADAANLFCATFLVECLATGPEGDWTFNRTLAAYEILRWFRGGSTDQRHWKDLLELRDSDALGWQILEDCSSISRAELPSWLTTR